MDDKLKKHVYDAVDQFCDERITEDNIKNWCVSRGVPHDDYVAFYESELGRLCLPPQSGGWDGPFSGRVLAVSRLARRAGQSYKRKQPGICFNHPYSAPL